MNQFYPLRRKLFSRMAFFLGCLCLTGAGNLAYGQLPFMCERTDFLEINPPTEFELETCGVESNSQYGSLLNGACPQTLVPSYFYQDLSFYGNFQGTSESPDDAPTGQGLQDVDDFLVTVPFDGVMTVGIFPSHGIDFSLSLFEIAENGDPCSLDQFVECMRCSPEDDHLNGSICGRRQEMEVTVGTYIIRVSGSHSENLGCGNFTYNLSYALFAPSLFNLDGIVPNSSVTAVQVGNHYAEPPAVANAQNQFFGFKVCRDYELPIDEYGNSSGDQSGFIHAFEAVSTKTIFSIQVDAIPNFDGVIQIGGMMLPLTLGCFNNAPPGEPEILILDTEIGEELTFGYYGANTIIPHGTPVKANVTRIPQTELRTADCGRMDLVHSSIIRSNWPLNRSNLSSKIVKWRFKFEELEAPFNTYEVFSPNGSNPQYRWSWFTQRQPGRTYKVWTSVLMQPGPTWSDYGNSCVIGTAPLETGIAAQEESLEVVGELSEIQFAEVWPNPSGDVINVSINTDINQLQADLRLYDLRGVEVDAWREPLLGTGHSLSQRSVNHLAEGIYLLHAKTSLGTTIKKVFVSRQ